MDEKAKKPVPELVDPFYQELVEIEKLLATYEKLLADEQQKY